MVISEILRTLNLGLGRFTKGFCQRSTLRPGSFGFISSRRVGEVAWPSAITPKGWHAEGRKHRSQIGFLEENLPQNSALSFFSVFLHSISGWKTPFLCTVWSISSRVPSHGRRIDVASCNWRLLLRLWPETVCLQCLRFERKAMCFTRPFFCNVFVVFFLCCFICRALRQSEHEPQSDHLRAFPSIS